MVTTTREVFRGWIAHSGQAKTPEKYAESSRRFRESLSDFCARTIIPFDDRAAAAFRRLKAAKVRVGTMDLRIAAICLAHNATLLTRNLSDFRRVPGLRAEDWTAG